MSEYNQYHSKKRIIFKKYDTYESLKLDMERATQIVNILYEIKEGFARNYIHCLNKVLFNEYLKDVHRMNKIIKEHFNFCWDTTFKKTYKESAKILNKCLSELNSESYLRLRFWKLIQADQDHLLKL